MSAPRLRFVNGHGERLLTIEDLTRLPDHLPSGPVRYELHEGRLFIMAPPGDIHGAVEGNLITQLKVQGEQRGLGKARCGEVGIVLGRNPDSSVGADAAFITNKSLPIRRSKEGYLETIPELVVEVRSKNDTNPKVRAKVKDYLKVGVQVVWVVDPKKKTVTEYRPKKKPRIYTTKHTLTIEDVIPGFRVPVKEVFQI